MDFSANNNSVTLSANTGILGSGSATRTLNLGNGTWTVVNTVDFTNSTGLTLNANSSTIHFTGTGTAGRSLINTSGSALTFSTITIDAASVSPNDVFSMSTLTNTTIATLNISAPNYLALRNGTTLKITNAFTWAGSPSSQFGFISSSTNNQSTISVTSGTCNISWAALRDCAFTGGATFNAYNSFNLGNTSGITINAPNATRSQHAQGQL